MSSDQGAPEAESASDLSPSREASQAILDAIGPTLGELPADVGIDASILVGTYLIETAAHYVINIGRPDIALALIDHLQQGLDNLREAACGQEEAGHQDEAAGA